MKELKQIVVAMGAMDNSSLRELRSRVQSMSGTHRARELVLNLIDLYLGIGDDPERRAAAAAACLTAIDDIERRSSRPSSSSSSSSDAAGSGGGAGVVIGLLVLGGVLLGVAWAVDIWPFG